MSKIKNATAKHTVTVKKKVSHLGGDFPPFIELGHRHLEKEATVPVSTTQGTYLLPVDLIRMVVPAELADAIEAVEIVYKKR